MKNYYIVDLLDKNNKKCPIAIKVLAKSEKEASRIAKKDYPGYNVDEIETSLDLTYKDLLDILNTMTKTELKMPIKVCDDKGKELYCPTLSYDLNKEIAVMVICD